jgi:hypothetical protein
MEREKTTVSLFLRFYSVVDPELYIPDPDPTSEKFPDPDHM